MENIWFDSWESIITIIYVTPVAYVAMVLLLRVSGKRTLSKMNAFDFVVTIALGSVLAGVALDKNIPLLNGVTAMLVFVFFQFLFTWLSVRIRFIQTLITSRPALIFYQGNFLHQVMKKERLTEEEIHSAVRIQGISSLDGVDMIILETTGDIAIIKKIVIGEKTTFAGVKMEL